eukprot:PITA_18742
MLIKLDMANAFDQVNCSFPFKVLLSFGFSSHFVNLIIACTQNPWIAPLVNGRPTSFFQAQRGLIQGCPLSPFLYILMANSLSRKLSFEKSSGSLLGLKPSISSPALNHALFADDSLLLGGAFARIAKAMDTVLKRYCGVSGASINERKSEVYGWNIGQRQGNLDKIHVIGSPNLSSNLSSCPKESDRSNIKNPARFSLARGKGKPAKNSPCQMGDGEALNSEGGLQIRDPALANLAMGGKMLWKLFKESSHPVSVMLKSKYACNVPLRNLQTCQIPNSTQTWKLYNRSLNLFKGKPYKIPGNCKRTNLWFDQIMDQNPLAKIDEIARIKEWLERVGITSIYDLSKWDRHGDWQGWDFLGVLERLQQQKHILEELLEDAAPVNRNSKDSWG